MLKLLKAFWIMSYLVVALAYPAAWGIARTATEAILITPFHPSKVVVNREMDAPDKKDPDFEKKVAALYGIVSEKKLVVFVPKERFLHPEEMPEMTLLPIDKDKGENPLQLQTIYFFAKWTVTGAGAAAISLMVLWLLLSRRQAGRMTSGSAPPSSAA